MITRIPVVTAILFAIGVLNLSCQEWQVGAPCVPETDNGEFTAGISQETTSIETRSVQCETGICMTVTQQIPGETPLTDEDLSEFDQNAGTQRKFSFCSCQCKDANDNTYDRNDDKLDRLCMCPSSTKCKKVIKNSIEGAPPKIVGGYCIPDCIIDGCDDDQVCSPSSNSDEPWNWSCK